jgi:hypothetical protein
MDNPVAWWKSLSAPWKAFVVTFLGGLLLFGLGGGLFLDPIVAIINAVMFGGIAGGLVRLAARLRNPPR